MARKSLWPQNSANTAILNSLSIQVKRAIDLARAMTLIGAALVDPIINVEKEVHCIKCFEQLQIRK